MEDHIPDGMYVRCSGKANHEDIRLMVRGEGKRKGWKSSGIRWLSCSPGNVLKITE